MKNKSSIIKSRLIKLLGLVFILVVILSFTPHQKSKIELTLADYSSMLKTKELINQKDSTSLQMYSKLLKLADKELNKKPYSVMNKIGVPPSGSKHDYLTLAPYFWPNPDTPDGLPYIRKDGEVNPECRDNFTDYEEKSSFFDATYTLTKAYFFSENIEYANKAIAFINAWFLDSATCMNPNLLFGQGVRGVNDGRPFGIIEFGGISNVITGLELLKITGVLPIETEKGMHKWLTDYSNWLQTSELGVMEGSRSNNHGTHYDIQLCSILLYLGEKDQVIERLENITKKRIAHQIEPDGRQPEELARTKSFSYSSMNLSGLTRLAWFGQKVGVDLWNYKTADGRSIRKAYEFLIPYLTTNKEWDYKQISGKDKINGKIRSMLKNAGETFNDEEFLSIVKEYDLIHSSEEDMDDDQ